MYIKSFRVRNYKCFSESDVIPLSRQFNIIVGQNNAGKSALIEALSLNRFGSKPHFSPIVPEWAEPDNNSIVECTVSMTGEEFKQTLLSKRRNVLFPVPADISNNYIRAYLDEIFSREEINFPLKSTNGSLSASNYPSHNLFIYTGEMQRIVIISPGSDYLSMNVSDIQTGSGDNVHEIISERITSRYFTFKAERLRIGRYQAGSATELNSDASNLPVVLNNLQSNRSLMTEYVDAVSSIIPGIKGIGVIWQNNEFVIRIDPSYHSAQRDFSLNLEDCGSGLSQILAMLYVIMRVRHGVVIIDEPNSFLHPGAVKRLMGYMKLNSTNQYIISTHTPDVISHPSISNIISVTKEENQSAARSIDKNDIMEIRSVLNDIGSSISDVFGLDHLIWVEGESESIIFPSIISSLQEEIPNGVEFLPMRTSDVSSKSKTAKIAIDLHERMAKSSKIMPERITFSFDRENRTQKEQDDIKRQLKHKCKFLPRRMLENYLLHPESISHLLYSETGRTNNVEEIRSEIEIFISAGGGVEDADGAKILKEIYWNYAAIDFIKTKHSSQIAQHMSENYPQSIIDLRDYITSLYREV